MTPRPAATLIVVRPGEKSPEVLMLERPAGGLFGGLWVFPGGAVEPIDEGLVAGRAVVVPDGCEDRGWRTAALRETVEEVGLAILDPPPDRALDALGGGVFEAVEDQSARLDGRRLRFLSQWVTPRGLPRRYDTRFYVTSLADPPPLLPRTGEVVDVAWVAPGEGLARAAAGEWAMARPTLHHLRWLARHRSVEAIWSAAEPATGERIEPLLAPDGSEVRVRLPAAVDRP